MASKYSQIPAGKIFEAKGGKFRKLDEMYYEDLQTGFQAVWNPMFDDTIATAPPAAPPPAGAVNTTDKFLVDQQTRMMTPNPNYRESLSEAEKVFAEMWGTALFDCGPEDYEYMALQSIKAVNLVGSILMILESVDTSPVTSDQIEGILNKWTTVCSTQPRVPSQRRRHRQRRSLSRRLLQRRSRSLRRRERSNGTQGNPQLLEGRTQEVRD